MIQLLEDYNVIKFQLFLEFDNYLESNSPAVRDTTELLKKRQHRSAVLSVRISFRD